MNAALHALAVELVEFDSEWMREAACRNRTDLPWTANRVTQGEVRRMQAVCARCPVFGSCAGFAEQVEVTAGVWAGVPRIGAPGASGVSKVRGWAS